MVNITWLCNLGTCPYCWVNRVVRRDNVLFYNPDHDANEWIKALNNLEPATFDFVGGEPLIFPNFVDVLEGLDEKHRYAITSNLHSYTALQRLIQSPAIKRCVHFTGSYHPSGRLSKDEFAFRLGRLPVQKSINIILHKSIPTAHSLAHFFKERGLTVHLSPYEEMQDLRYTTEKLSCNAGLTHYVISNNGDVHPCLSWFRFTDRDKRKMGNIFDGSFKKFPDRQECNLFCEMEHVVDQSNSMVKDLATKKCESS